jgi:ribosomal protein S18 acetylase RimI-like enzyme
MLTPTSLLFPDVRVTADLLTQVFFRNNTNVFTYAWEWCFTFLSMDSDFPQPPATRRRIPQDILIAEYVLKSSSKSNAKGIIVEAVGMVQVDGRLERMPWKQSLSLTHTQTIMGPQDVIVTSSHHYHNNHSSTAFLQQQQVERPVYLCNLAVLESWRRRGIATQLIQACEALVSINGEYQQPTMLCLKVRRNMPHVVAMYEKLGYAMFQPPAVVVIQGLRKQSTSSRLVEDTNQDHDSIWWMAKSLPTVEEETTTTDTTNVVPETQFVTAPEE